jgi:hypothetical protein
MASCLEMTINPAEAGGLRIRQRIERLRNNIQDGGTNIRFNYSPPRLPVSASCDPQGQVYGTVSPRLRTPAGSFGVSATRRIRSLRCK